MYRLIQFTELILAFFSSFHGKLTLSKIIVFITLNIDLSNFSETQFLILVNFAYENQTPRRSLFTNSDLSYQINY
ncbi:hypothetical protein BpHYR1_023716 [Brachionus plicatilis]|uniref:Uncharacterized protein n=1 Tax=Brachionus plicatilis TaxID=10195 RepID=A0A3M7RTY7_BRAPC|nr:hypothetical protein BpHYR1_023716 [Brachionus plicatilis]